MKKIFIIIILFINNSSLCVAENFKLEKILDLENPWGSSFIDKDELIITEKSGKIKLINLFSKEKYELEHNLDIIENRQGGLLDIIFENNYIYVSYTENRGEGKTSTSIARAKFDKNKLNFKNIFQANPPIDSSFHYGSRLVIKGNHIYASAGERGKGMIAQDPT